MIEFLNKHLSMFKLICKHILIIDKLNYFHKYVVIMKFY